MSARSLPAAVVVLSMVCHVSAGTRPNFLFLLTDDQSARTLAAYDPAAVCRTPNIDRLAAEGMRLTDAHHMGAWSGAVCTPSRTMIMTGRTVWHIPGGSAKRPVKGIDGSADFRRACAEASLPAVFNRAGYDTFRTCKNGNSFDQANRRFTVRRTATKRGSTDETGSVWHGDRVMEYLRQREADGDDDPFLIYFGFSHPHDPRDAPPALLAWHGARNEGPPAQANDRLPPLPDNWLPAHPFPHGHPGLRDEVAVQGVLKRRDPLTVRNEIGREAACIENIDAQIGRVLEHLESTGQLGNTYVIFTSDHGMSVGRHGLMGKQNLYEHTWKVPFIVRGPGIAPGSSASGFAYLSDVLPTLCDLAGIGAPAGVEGRSLRPVLEGKAERVRDVLYGVYCGGTKPGMRSLKTADGWKLIEYDTLGGAVRKTQLFDLNANPREFLAEHHDPAVVAETGRMPERHQVDLSSDPEHAGKLAEMRAALAAEMKRLDDPYSLADNPVAVHGGPDAPLRTLVNVLTGGPPAGEPIAGFDRDRAVLEENPIPHGPLPEPHHTHAATITEAADGTLVAAWFAGTAENHPDVKVWSSHRPTGGAWSEPTVVDDGTRQVDGRSREFACWNPVLLTHPDGTLYCWYKITGSGSRSGPNNWWGAVRTSADAGRTWSERVWLPTIDTADDRLAAFRPYDGHLTGPVKNRPLVMPDGSLLCGSSTESPLGWRVHFERYAAGDWTGRRHGAEVVGPIDGKDGIQPTFLVHSEDMRRLQVLTREDGAATSDDGGRSWTPLATGPIDTSKGLHAATTAGGWHFLAFNPSGRTPLSLARSRDGRTWQTVLPRLNADGGETMDYPTLMQSRDGRLHVVHTYGRRFINHLVLDAAYLSRPAPTGSSRESE